jgi:hypothetical protein
MNYSGTGCHMGPTVLGITGEHKKGKKTEEEEEREGAEGGFCAFWNFVLFATLCCWP